MTKTVTRGPGFDPAPETEQLEAQAAVTGRPLPAGQSPPVSALSVLTDAVAAGRVPSNWFDQDNPVVCWYEQSCHTSNCEPVCDDCGSCDDEVPADLECDLTDAAPPTMRKAVAVPFRNFKRVRYNDCAREQGLAEQIVRANTAKFVGRTLHKALAKHAKVLNDGKCVGCFATAFGLLDQQREVYHDGTSWKTIPRAGIHSAKSEGVIERTGSRLADCANSPIVTGGVSLSGPIDPDTGEPMPATEGCVWIWGHGPADYGLTDVRTKSSWDAAKNEGLEQAEQFGFVRVDSCGVYAVLVSLKCGGCCG